MNEKSWGAVLGGLVLAAGGVLWWLSRAPPPAPEPAPAVAAAGAPAPPAPAPPADYPVPAPEPATPPLPTLDDSDAALGSALAELIGREPFAAFVVPDRLIRRIVATIDNLPRERAAPALRPLRRPPPPVRVESQAGAGSERVVLSATNADRYEPQVRLFTGLDAGRLVALYFRWYPVFERAYVELGYPGRSFNNRLVEVIDHLLATPPAPAEIVLVQPKVAYEFADPRLEALSAGQKVILKLAPAQRDAVFAQLRAIRAALVAGSAAAKP